jgi:hypothetical protein
VQKTLAGINLVLAFLATLPLAAHVLELPAKLSLDGPMWLTVQQRLYRGWGPIFGPIEIAALATAAWLYFISPAQRRSYLIAGVCFALMLVCFFVFNDPVNKAVLGWTVSTLPADWPDYRARWEIGHALAAALSVIAFFVLVVARARASSVSSPGRPPIPT